MSHFRVGDLIEDNEGDKAVVREVAQDGRLGIEWECRPGEIVWPAESYVSWASFTNLSETVRELDKASGYWPPHVSLTYECPGCGDEVDIRKAQAL